MQRLCWECQIRAIYFDWKVPGEIIHHFNGKCKLTLPPTENATSPLRTIYFNFSCWRWSACACMCQTISTTDATLVVVVVVVGKTAQEHIWPNILHRINIIVAECSPTHCEYEYISLALAWWSSAVYVIWEYGDTENDGPKAKTNKIVCMRFLSFYVVQQYIRHMWYLWILKLDETEIFFLSRQDIWISFATNNTLRVCFCLHSHSLR